ncbi:MAG TPA: hypothetical protein VEF72_10545 [Mycobacterium sp.]|nr:hypothetical protein [Mycobacterium sp.]
MYSKSPLPGKLARLTVDAQPVSGTDNGLGGVDVDVDVEGWPGTPSSTDSAVKGCSATSNSPST